VAERPYGPQPWQEAEEESEIARITGSRIASAPSPSKAESQVTAVPTVTPLVQKELEEAAQEEYRQDFLSVPESTRRKTNIPRRPRVISEQERARYGLEGIAQQKDFEAELDRVESNIMDPLSVESMSPEMAEPEARGITGSAQISRIDAKNTLPLSKRNDFDSKEDFVISNYPTLYKAAQNAGLNKGEIYDVVNLTLAVDAALTVGSTRNARRQRELINSMPGPQAALTIDILNALSAESRKYDGTIGTRKVRKAAEIDPDENLNPIANFLKSWFWDPSIDISGLPFIYPDTDWGPIEGGKLYGGAKGALDVLTAASETTIRGIGTTALAAGAAREEGGLISGPPSVFAPGGLQIPTPEQITNAWNATGAGSFDPTMIREIRANNDPLAVDIMMDLKKFRMMGVEDVEGAVFEKYGDDPRAERILDQIMFETDPNGDMARLGRELDMAETSNIGNLVTWSLANTLGFNAGDYESIKRLADNELVVSATKVATVATTLAADPTLAAARFGQGIRSAKYGLAKFTKGQVGPFDPERLEKVFNTAGVRNHYDYLGKQFDEIRVTGKTVNGKFVSDTGEQGKKFAVLSSQMRKWYDPNALRIMYDAGIKNADDAKAFMLDSTHIDLLLSGQKVKRGKEFTAPHMTKANAVWKAVTFKARGLNPANMGGPRRYLEALYGTKLSDDVTDDVAMSIIRKIEEDPESAGRILSDWAMTGSDGIQRTIFGKIIKPDPESYKLRNRYGWRRKGIMTGDVGWFADRVGRLFARIPDTSFGISVATADDTKLIKQYIQSLGMSRYFANEISFLWSTLDEATRIRFVNAINNSAIYSTGMDLVNPALADDFARVFATASRPGTQYAPDQVDVLAVRLQAEKNVRRLDSFRRESNLAALTPEERAAKVDEQMQSLLQSSSRNNLKKEVADLAKSGGVSEKYVFHTTSNLDIIESGLQRGGIAGGPLMEQGYGEVIHVFRRSSFPKNVSFGDVTLTPGWGSTKAPKPVASFTYRELGIDPDDLALGARADELGYQIEPPVQLTDEELTAIANTERRIQLEIAAKYGSLKPLRKSDVEGLSGEERRLAMRAELLQGIEDAKVNGRIYNPSALNATDNYALYDTQLAKRAALFNPQSMNQMMARQSYLNILLGGGPKMSSVTDWWVLATLAGPRFVMRSGIEDFGLYAFTGGAFFGHDGWLMGRRAKDAIRESIERVEPTTKPIIRGRNKGMPLSLATSARREIGTSLAKRIPAMRGLVLPYATPEELAEVTAMASARGSERSREGIANLFGALFARSRFFSLNRARYAKGEPLVLKGRDKQNADWIADGVERGYLNSNMERAAETGQHLADGSVPAFKVPKQDSEVVDGVVLNYTDVAISEQRVREVTKGFGTSWQKGARDVEDVENFWMELDTVLYQDGPKGYLAVALSPKYYNLKAKLTRAKNSGNPKRIAKAEKEYKKFIDDYIAVLEEDPNLVRYVLAKELGVRQFAERKLDDALRMMTTNTGLFNKALYDRLKLPEGAIPARKGRKPAPESTRKLGLYYFDEEGALKYNLGVDDLHRSDIPMPQSVSMADKFTVPVADKLPMSTRAWNKMGRALARLTREPIYIANFTDMRRLVEPFRMRMVDDLVKNGKSLDEATEMADDWAAKTAADKAYDLTMSLADNPAVRSQLAWQVRNVARFYRALEDFNRRMLRVAENKPETFWKMALTWNVLDDSGFVWEDEFGEKYFLFPGTQVAFDAINGFASLLGIQPRVPGLPMTWGARVNMLAPSTDPNALVPTLGSPWSGLTVRTMLRLMPSLPVLTALAEGLKDVPVAGQVTEFAASEKGAQTLERSLFGEYGVNQTLISSLANDVFGPNLKRAIDVFQATQGGFQSRNQATDAYIAGASKRSIHALVASGLYDPKKDYTPEQLEELRMIADVTAINEVWLRLVLTPALIATPQPVSLTVSDVAREIGIDSGNALWLKYLNRYDSYEEAFLAFTKDNPGKAIFTVSKYESDDYYQMLLETEDYIRENMDEFEARPTGLSHFAPQEGTYGGLQSFYFMRANEIRVPSTVEDFFNKSIRATGQAELRWIEVLAEDRRAKAGNDEARIKQINQAELNAKSRIKEVYPYSEYEIDFSLDRKQESIRDADEIAKTAQYVIDKGIDSDGRAAKYLNAYNQYLDASREMSKAADNEDRKKLVREAWRRYIQRNGLSDFGGDDRGLRYLRILSNALGIVVEGL